MAEDKTKLGAAAAAAGILAFGSVALTCTGHAVWGLLAALLSIPCGAVGFVWAAVPRRRGGILSLVSIVVGAIATVIALVGLLF